MSKYDETATMKAEQASIKKHEGVVLAKRKFTTLSQLFTIQCYYQNIPT